MVAALIDMVTVLIDVVAAFTLRCVAGTRREGSKVQQHVERPHDNREKRKPRLPLDGLSSLSVVQGHSHGDTFLAQRAAHSSCDVDNARGLIRFLGDTIAVNGAHGGLLGLSV